MAPNLEDLSQALYTRCVSDFGPDHLLYQQDLISLKIVPKDDLSLLLKCTQTLVDRNLMRLLHGKDDRLAWKVIAQSDAEKLQKLSSDERLIYTVIHSTGRNGVWTGTLKSRTNLHQTIVNRCLKSLEKSNYIKSVRNVKYPSRKMYMLAGLQPSEDITGGAWFTDGVLDADFIRGLSGWVEQWISAKSWHKAAPAHRDKNRVQKNRAAPKSEGPTYLPYLASYKSYPTVTDITNAINKSGITPVTMGETSIAQLLEMLCYDGKLISLRGGAAYKSVKKPSEITIQKDLGLQGPDGEAQGKAEDNLTLGGNGMTEAPCGRCPVFSLCHEGGPVNAENCEYFNDWLIKALDF